MKRTRTTTLMIDLEIHLDGKGALIWNNEDSYACNTGTVRMWQQQKYRMPCPIIQELPR